MERVFLLLGSNQGDRSAALRTARLHLGELGELKVASAVYKTAAWGKTSQPEFYNQVVEIATPLQPAELLKTILEIELRMGRERLERWGQRIIDIDILLFGDRIIDEPGLIIPHPQMASRRFTLIPLAEIAEQLIHPSTGMSIREMLDNCSDSLMVTKIPS